MDVEKAPENTKAPKTGLMWRIAAGLGALLVIGVLVWPLLNNRSENVPVSTGASVVSSPTPDDILSAPEATAQADPDSPEAQFELGNAYYQAGRLENAVEAYRAAIELDPNYQAAYANLGVAYYQLEQFELAARQYEKAIELDPQDGDVAYNLGALYLQQALSQEGEQPDRELLSQALAQLERAQEISPNLAEPHFTLGVAYLFLNDPVQARESFETFLSLGAGQDARARQEAERYLEMLDSQ